MIHGRVQIRRYETQIRTLLKHLGLFPDEKNHWLDRDLHVVVSNPLDSTHLADYTATRDQATGLGLHAYPAFRTQPLSCHHQPPFKFPLYISSNYWQTNADRLTNLAALRLPGDPWIGLDMENYAVVRNQQDCPTAHPSDGRAPTASALAAHGFTVDQLRVKMQPFIAALQATNASVAVYPASEASSEDLLYVAEILGPGRVELWTESTYMNAEHYRRSSARGWPAAATRFLKLMGQLQERFPGYLVRPGINDLERLWSDPYRRDRLRSGPAAPWGYDETRYDHTTFGTLEYRAGINLSELNRVRHVWPMQPMLGQVPAEFDTTLTATPKPLTAVAETRSGVAVSWTLSLHPDGLQFVTPAGRDTWSGLRGAGVLPNLSSSPFTVDGTLRLPSGPINSCPLFGAVDKHIGVWQVAYDATRDVIALYVRRPSPPPGQPVRHVLDMMLKPPRGAALRFQVGRDGNNWLHQASHNAIPADQVGNRTTLPDDAGVFDWLIIGAGQDVSAFPKDNTLAGCPGIVLVETWCIYDWLLTDAQLAELRAGPRLYWPYGYGRGHQ